MVIANELLGVEKMDGDQENSAEKIEAFSKSKE